MLQLDEHMEAPACKAPIESFSNDVVLARGTRSFVGDFVPFLTRQVRGCNDD
jgi:hypothetical protein